MKSRIFIPVIFLSLLFSCDQIIGNEDSDPFTIFPNEVSILDQSDRSVTFEFINTCSSSCWKNIKHQVKKSGENYTVKVLAESSGNACPAVCGLLEKEIKIEVKRSGSYNFSFVHRDSVHHEFNLSFP